MSKVRLTVNMGLMGLSLGAVMMTSAANAQSFLVGAYLFGADGSGTTVSTVYQYGTDANTADFGLNISALGSKSISTALGAGANPFTFAFANGSSTLPGPNGDLGLYFDTTNTPYNPTVPARTPDLLVSRDSANALAFFVPAPGSPINDYHYAGTLLASGGNSINIGGNTISVTAYSLGAGPSGAFTLSVTPLVAPAPEPGVTALLAGMGVSGGVFALRRRRRNVKK